MLGYKNKRQVLTAYSIIIGFGVTTFVIRLIKFQQFTFVQQVLIFLSSLLLVSLCWELFRFVNRKLNDKIPFEENVPRRIIIQLLIGVFIGFLARFVVFKWGEPHLPFKLDELFLMATWALFPLVTVGVNMGFFVSYFLERWKDELIKAERLEKEKSQVQFDNLKNQLNPHFLFNALTSLNSLIFADQKLASDFLQQLAKVYRYVLQNKDKNYVTLKEELKFIRHYVSLLETRFHGSVIVNFDIAANCLDRNIVPVTLQILIENALKHNIVDQNKPLTLEIITSGDYLVVSNNLQVRNSVETSNGLGLENLKSLYRFLTEEPVIIEQTTDRFFVRIPIL